MTSIGSNPGSSTPSNRRSPLPSRTGTTSRRSSSIARAAKACRTVEAPPAMSTSRSAGGSPRLLERRVEALGDKMEGGSARHLDRLMCVVGKHEDRRVVGRLVAPPASPVFFPVASDGSEHVAAHDVGAARFEQLVARADVRLVAGLASVPVPLMEPQTADADGWSRLCSGRRRSRRARWTCGTSCEAYRVRPPTRPRFIGLDPHTRVALDGGDAGQCRISAKRGPTCASARLRAHSRTPTIRRCAHALSGRRWSPRRCW